MEAAAVQNCLQALHCLDLPALIRIRPVHQHEIDVVDTQPLQARLVCLANPIDAVPPAVELCGDDDLRPINAGIPDGLSDRVLIAIVLGRVDQSIAGLEGRPDLSRRLRSLER